MKIIDYNEPMHYKDKQNKKWCLYYQVKFEGSEKWKPQKEYSKNYWGKDPKSLDSIFGLEKREVAFYKAITYFLMSKVSIKFYHELPYYFR
jgi:hypothetical protein